MSVRVAVEEAEDDVFTRTALHGELYEASFDLGVGAEAVTGPLRFVPAAMMALREHGIALRPAGLWCHSSLPAGRGFSSSAAFCLSVLDGLARHAGVRLTATELAQLAFHTEAKIVGVPCGMLDPLACVAGAPVFLQWDGDSAPLRRIRPARTTHLVLGVFSRPRDTMAILCALSSRWQTLLVAPRDPADVAVVREAITVWGSAATRGAHALTVGDLLALGEAMNEAQGAYERAASQISELEAPGLVAACAALRAEGALGAKFSGAGGDGSVIALARTARHAERLAGTLSDRGLAVWKGPLEET